MCPNALLFYVLLLASDSPPTSAPAAGATAVETRLDAAAGGTAAMPDIEANTVTAADADHATAAASVETVAEIPNPAIDMPGFLSTAEAAA